MLLQLERLVQRLHDTAGDLGGVLPARDVGDSHDELVPPEARHRVARGERVAAGDRVGRAQALLQALRDRLQQPVAHAVPQGVVNPLEPVEVQEQHGQRGPLTLRGRQRLVEPLHEQGPVRQPGQPVVVRQEADLLLGLFALGDVLRRAGEPQRSAVVVEDHLRLLVHEADGAVGHQETRVEAVRALLAHRLAGGARDQLSILRMHALEIRRKVGREALRVDAEDPEGLLRPAHAPGLQLALPVAETRDTLRAGETGLAVAQVVDGALGAQHVAQAVSQDEQVDRLGREQVIAVLQSLDRARFPALEDRAFTWCFDSASVGISVSADGSTKRVVSDSYCDGAKTGAQAQFVQAAHEIDAILDSKRWVSCDGPCRE